MKRLIFGGILANILLILYVYAVWNAVRIAQCLSQQGCTSYTAHSLTDGMLAVLMGVGGLISALVVAELAMTEPGNAPTARLLQGDISKGAQEFAKWNSLIYLAVWVLAGLAAFIVGVMQHPKVFQPLTDIGAAWFGLALTAVYSYIGVKQPQ